MKKLLSLFSGLLLVLVINYYGESGYRSDIFDGLLSGIVFLLFFAGFYKFYELFFKDRES